MAVVIGALTTTGVAGSISAQWGVQLQINRLWQLGSWTPYSTVATAVENVSITTYAGAVGSVSLAPSTGCTDSTAIISVNISPAACGGGVAGLSGSFFLMSYSYSKGDAIGLGQESWNGQRWPGGGSGGGGSVSFTDAPSFVLQGPSEGSESGDVPNTGITFGGGPTVNGSQGSVSAGFPGLGQADAVTYGIVSGVGGGSLKADGKVGQGSASVPHQPVYLG